MISSVKELNLILKLFTFIYLFTIYFVCNYLFIIIYLFIYNFYFTNSSNNVQIYTVDSFQNVLKSNKNKK